MTGPRFRAPMLATLVDDGPDGDEWIFERKFDGVRLVAVRVGDEVGVFSRNRIDRGARDRLHRPVAVLGAPQR